MNSNNNLIIVLVLVLLQLLFARNNKKNNHIEPYKEMKKNKHNKMWIKYKQRVYEQILKRTMMAMNELNIPLFLSSGTLLGYFREGKFMDHDYDIDVGIMLEDYDDRIPEVMRKYGLHMYRTLGNLDTGYEMSFKMKDKYLERLAKIDIFVHYREKVKDKDNKLKDKIYWVSYAAPKFESRIKYRVSDFKLKKVRFGGTKVYVPDPALKYIVEHYGGDWFVSKKGYGKDKEYSYSTSPTSIVKEDQKVWKGARKMYKIPF